MNIDWQKTTKLHNKTKKEMKAYFEKYPKSHKLVYRKCKCGDIKLVEYRNHNRLCNSCAKTGKNHPFYKNSVGNKYYIDDKKEKYIKVLKEIGRNKQGAKIVLTQCHCGNKFEVLEGNLKNGKTKSCGCLPIGGYKNSIGNKYSIGNNKEIIVLKEINQDKYGQKIVLAQCHCGNKFEVLEHSLQIGQKSCGHCLEITEIGKVKNGIKLLKFEYRDKYSQIHFKAKCHCGNIFIINYNNWKKGQKSCGCLKSHENTDIELIMQKELEKRNYNFKTQFKVLSYKTDILLTDYNIIIECDGRY